MLEEAAAAAKDLGVPQFVNVQNDYSLLDRTPEAEVIPACEKLGITLMPYFPLASGVLTGKYKRGEPAPGGHAPRGVGRPRRGDVRPTRSSTSSSGSTAYAKDARAHAARARALVAREHAHGRERDRGRDLARAGARRTPPPRRAWQLTDAERAEVGELASADG